MDTDLAPKAVSLALSGNWKEAISVNLTILKKDPQNIDALNRLGRAYAELGNIQKARKCSMRVLEFDPINSIAGKALCKWKEMKSGRIHPFSSLSSAKAFLEDPGKTKIVSLMHLGSYSTLSELDSGDRVKLDYHCHRIAVTTTEGKYIGRLSDDLSARLKKLISLENKYETLIKSIDPQSQVKIFIRETARGKKAAQIISFPGDKIELIPPDELFP